MNRAESVEELKQTFAILDDDIDEIRNLAQGKVTGFYVRASIRAYSALVDGLLFQMRQVVISSEPSELSIFSPEEKMMLREKSFTLDKKGQIKERDSFEKPLPMLLFTFKQFAKIHGTTFQPETSDYGWECLSKFISIRNRVTHPKSRLDLELSNDEWLVVNKGIDWFHINVKKLLIKVFEADEYYRDKLV